MKRSNVVLRGNSKKVFFMFFQDQFNSRAWYIKTFLIIFSLIFKGGILRNFENKFSQNSNWIQAELWIFLRILREEEIRRNLVDRRGRERKTNTKFELFMYFIFKLFFSWKFSIKINQEFFYFLNCSCAARLKISGWFEGEIDENFI